MDRIRNFINHFRTPIAYAIFGLSVLGTFAGATDMGNAYSLFPVCDTPAPVAPLKRHGSDRACGPDNDSRARDVIISGIAVSVGASSLFGILMFDNKRERGSNVPPSRTAIEMGPDPDFENTLVSRNSEKTPIAIEGLA